MTHHLITGSSVGVPVLACGTPWEDGATSGEPTGASRFLSPLTCSDCRTRCPDCAVAPRELHHRACRHPSAASRRSAAPAPVGPVFSWKLSGTPEDIASGIEDLAEDNPLSRYCQELVVKILGRHHPAGLVALNLSIDPQPGVRGSYTISASGRATT